jgi:lysophospholipid acyltransferase (LPLAT)-like uncharacterized protein
VAAWVVVAYMRVVYFTNRWRRVRFDIAERVLAAERRVVICFWHGRLLMMPFGLFGPRPFGVMISSHRDGRVIARVIRPFGIEPVSGSSSRQPMKALRNAARLCRGGSLVGITPDGPRGPRQRAAPGAVMLAELADAVLLPVSYATSRRRTLGSWDRFLLPLPFGRGVFVIGQEIAVPADLDSTGRETLRRTLEDALNAANNEADRLTGHPVAEAA